MYARTALASLVAIALIAAGCGSNDDSIATTPETQETAEPADNDTVATQVAFEPGTLATGDVNVDGTTVEYITITPDGFERGDTAPVMFAFPPGGQDFGLTRSVAEGTYMDEALARGWVVVSPAAPDGELFFRGSESLVPGLLDWLDTWVAAEGGAPHVVGISNGGISSFRAAAQNPDRFRSLVVFPGFASEDDLGNLDAVANIPVRMFVGETDTGWVESMQGTLDSLAGLGGDATLEIVPGAGHIIADLSDGVRVFDELDALR